MRIAREIIFRKHQNVECWLLRFWGGGGRGYLQTGGWGVLSDGVFVEEDRNERGGWDGDEGSDDAGESGAEEKGYEDGEPHEIDAGPHDARDEEGVLEVDVDEVEDEDAGHLGP